MSTTLVASEPAVQVSSLEKAGTGRLLSLDVFRGATIASMMLVNNAGNWNAVYPPLRHSAWHGWTFTDTIFPFFLWIAGVSMTLLVREATGTHRQSGAIADAHAAACRHDLSARTLSESVSLVSVFNCQDSRRSAAHRRLLLDCGCHLPLHKPPRTDRLDGKPIARLLRSDEARPCAWLRCGHLGKGRKLCTVR